MGNEVTEKYRDRFIKLGLAIAATRKLQNLSQEKLADKAGISRSLLSYIEAPGCAKSFSLEVLFRIADALEVDAVSLLQAEIPVSTK